MILSETDIKDLITRSTIIDLEELDLVQTYIFERKGIDVGSLQRPTNLINIQLMQMAFNHAVNYYSKKFNGN